MAIYHFTLKSDRKPNGAKIMAGEHAEYNEREGRYEKIDEQRESVQGSDHVDYINREASFAVKEGCIYKGHHLPAWADGSPKKFFAVADIYEESEHTYKEFEFALQKELTLEQNLEIINGFIARNFSDYYYAYAVHDKTAALGNGEKNLHCHFMFSPRQLDELEKEKEREPGCFFKKARRVYTKADGTVIDNRREGGCKIPPVWNKLGPGVEHLKYLRKDFEEITNNVLQKYGHIVTVDCRSHEVRKAAAIKNGNQLEIDLFSIPPEKHLGPAAVHNPDDPRVIAIKKLRKLRYETQKMIEASDRLEKLSADRDMTENQEQLSAAVQEIDENTSDISLATVAMSEEETALLDENIIAAKRETAAKLTEVIYFAAAARQAREEMMKPEERVAQHELKKACQEKTRLKNAWEEIEEREKDLRAEIIIAVKKKLPGYSLVAEIENADPEKDGKKNMSKLSGEVESADKIISMEKIKAELKTRPEYLGIVQIKEELSEKIRSNHEDVAAKALCLKETIVRFATPERTYKRQERALQLFYKNQLKRDAFQKSSAAELALLKQKMRLTGGRIAALQSDVILYRNAIEEAKEIYLSGLKKLAELRLPALEKEIETIKKQTAEKETSSASGMPKETGNALAEELAAKVLAREKLLREQEMLAVFQQHKIVSQEVFDLKRQLRQADLRQKLTKDEQTRREIQLQKESLTQKISAIDETKSNREQMQAIRKIFAKKDVKSALTRAANKITLGNMPQRKEIEVLQDEQSVTVERIRSLMAARIKNINDTAIAGRLSEQNDTNELLKQKNKAARRYTAVEIRKTIYDTLTAIRAEKTTLNKTIAPLEALYISEARAKKMAIDIYTENKTKELRELNRAIEKSAQRFKKTDDTLLTKEHEILNTPKPKWFEKLLGRSAVKQYETNKQELELLRIAVKKEEAALNALKETAAKIEFEVNKVLDSPESAGKLEQITKGILKKNRYIAEQVFSLRGQKSSLERQEKEFVNLANAATRQIKADSGRNISYAPAKGIEKTEQGNISVVSLIAKAFSGNDTACAAVMRIQDDDSSLLDWEAKDPAERQALQRESSWSR
ncbi:MAG: MobA/MobL family protein [Sporomusaceae bacterium]|jgi:hypothetical protein|nr:MobA/MobL family protein [Sporomusaceae bacterium]